MSQLLFDQLRFTDKLKASGFDDRQARGVNEAFSDALSESVATKSDITDLRTEIASVRTELKADIAELRAATKSDIAELRVEIAKTANDLLLKVFGANIALAGVLIAALKFFH